jgi:hypothetical protein
MTTDDTTSRDYGKGLAASSSIWMDKAFQSGLIPFLEFAQVVIISSQEDLGHDVNDRRERRGHSPTGMGGNLG